MSAKGTSPVSEPNQIILGAGAVYKNFDLAGEVTLGATAGGSVFDFGRTIEALEIDGGQGEVQGMHIKTEMIPMLTINQLQLTDGTIEDMIPGSTTTDRTTYLEILENLCITDADYLTNIAIVGDDKSCNMRVAIILFISYVSNSPQMTFEKNAPIIPEIEFKGVFDRNDLEKVPYEIRYFQDDIIAPTVIADPTDGASAVAVDATLTFTFNETMDKSTLNSSNILLFEQDGTPIPFDITIDATSKIVTIVQTSDLPSASAIIMIATIGCKDLAGNGLAAQETINFGTA